MEGEDGDRLHVAGQPLFLDVFIPDIPQREKAIEDLEYMADCDEVRELCKGYFGGRRWKW